MSVRDFAYVFVLACSLVFLSGMGHQLHNGYQLPGTLEDVLNEQFTQQGDFNWKQKYSVIADGYHKDSLRRMLLYVFTEVVLLLFVCIDSIR